jgi:hypothetical protein
MLGTAQVPHLPSANDGAGTTQVLKDIGKVWVRLRSDAKKIVRIASVHCEYTVKLILLRPHCCTDLRANTRWF